MSLPLPSASFPTTVWDGDTAVRTPSDNKAPDGQDWDRMAAEIIAAQNELNEGVDGSNVKNVANANVVGGVPIVFRINAAALTGDVDVVMTHKVRIIDAWCVATAAGGASDTITVKNGATAITNAMDLNVSDNVIVRAGTIDDAQHEIDAAGTLRISGASAVNAIVYVKAIKVA